MSESCQHRNVIKIKRRLYQRLWFKAIYQCKDCGELIKF